MQRQPPSFVLRRKAAEEARRAGEERSRVREEEELQKLVDTPIGSWAKGLELDLRLREFEINQLTQRNNFFMIFQGVLVAGLVQSQGTAAPILTVGMALLGIATSLSQVCMAGGAKYWQSRWEASTRSSELQIVLQLLKRDKLAIRTFTLDTRALAEHELKQIDEWNKEQQQDDYKLADLSEYIDQIVASDVTGQRKSTWRVLDLWVRRWAILPKWSVSRIPIWCGAFLFAFWLGIALQCVHVPSLDGVWPKSLPIELVPLKPDTPAATTNESH